MATALKRPHILTARAQIFAIALLPFAVAMPVEAQSTLRIIDAIDEVAPTPPPSFQPPDDLAAGLARCGFASTAIVATPAKRQSPKMHVAGHENSRPSVLADRPASYVGEAGDASPMAVGAASVPCASSGGDELVALPPADLEMPSGNAPIASHGPDMGLPTCECPYYPLQSGTPTINGVDCGHCRAPCDGAWDRSRRIPWSTFGPGEYVGPARREHVFQYFIRVNDQLEVVFLRTRNKTAQPYVIGVGDRLLIESVADESLTREIDVQPDGAIWLPMIGAVQAAGNTVAQLQAQLEDQYRKLDKEPAIAVTPITVNIPIQDLLDSVTAQLGATGQSRQVRVTPEGTIQMPGLGSVYVQGLTLDELRRELEARYEAAFGPGLTIDPLLTQKAPSLVFIGGEVKSPGRYELEGPTTVMQAIALAGGWNVGGNTRQIVVFRRDENWCLKATKIDLRQPLYGHDPCPINDIWLRDNDLLLVPKTPILVADDVINLYFTRGVYSVFPLNFSYNWGQGTLLGGGN